MSGLVGQMESWNSGGVWCKGTHRENSQGWKQNSYKLAHEVLEAASQQRQEQPHQSGLDIQERKEA